MHIPAAPRGVQQHSPSFSPAGRVPGGRGAGLCVGVVPSRPRPGKEAVAGQKSSALLSVWVLLSLLPVFAWEAAGTGVHDKEGSGGGSEGPGGWSWCSFPRSSPENTPSSVTSRPRFKCCPHVPPHSYKVLVWTCLQPSLLIFSLGHCMILFFPDTHTVLSQARRAFSAITAFGEQCIPTSPSAQQAQLFPQHRHPSAPPSHVAPNHCTCFPTQLPHPIMNSHPKGCSPPCLALIKTFFLVFQKVSDIICLCLGVFPQTTTFYNQCRTA